MNYGFEWTMPLAKENRGVVTRDGADISSRLEPTDLESECITVVPLSPFDVFNGEFRRDERTSCAVSDS